VGERVLLAQGREAEVFLEPDGAVLKLMRDPDHEDRVHREAAALTALRAHGHRAPEPRRIVTVDRRPGLVMERVDGIDLLSAMGRRPLSVLRTGTVMGEVHAAMHDCPAPADLPDVRDEIRRRIGAAAGLPADLRDAALAVLDTLPGGDRLCHGDLHPGNMLGSLDAPVVIDWGDAARGDPTGDHARTLLVHRVGVPPAGAPAVVRMLTAPGRRILLRRYRSAYRRRRQRDAGQGPDPRQVARWEEVWAAARMCEPVPEEEHAALLRLLDRER
jgi:thiamine kinase